MNDTERLRIVAEELMLSDGELEALVGAADGVRYAIAASELIAGVSRGDGILLATPGWRTRATHPAARQTTAHGARSRRM